MQLPHKSSKNPMPKLVDAENAMNSSSRSMPLNPPEYTDNVSSLPPLPNDSDNQHVLVVPAQDELPTYKETLCECQRPPEYLGTNQQIRRSSYTRRGNSMTSHTAATRSGNNSNAQQHLRREQLRETLIQNPTGMSSQLVDARFQRMLDGVVQEVGFEASIRELNIENLLDVDVMGLDNCNVGVLD